jgi:hypothetical protein
LLTLRYAPLGLGNGVNGLISTKRFRSTRMVHGYEPFTVRASFWIMINRINDPGKHLNYTTTDRDASDGYCPPLIARSNA